MDDQVAAIDEDPVAQRVPLHVPRPQAVRAQPVQDGVADRLRLPALIAGADDERVRERGDAFEVEGDRVLRLPLGRRFQNESKLFTKQDERLPVIS